MRHFWALPAFLRLVVASQHQFNVFDDLLAFPQYEVVIGEGVLSEEEAHDALEAISSRNAASRSGAFPPSEPTVSPESSLHSVASIDTKSGGADFKLNDDILLYEDMILRGERYLCSIPRIPDDEGVKNETSMSKEDEEHELARATTRGWELLSSMQDRCLYFYSGWWSYSFCYGDTVRQFHQKPPGKNVPIFPPVEDPSVDAYVLGNYESIKENKQDQAKSETNRWTEKGVARLETKGEMRYLVQKLSGGTTCDLTGRERHIEVQFRCQPNQGDKITLIKETSTCQYLMIIDTPRLCNDVAFQPPQEVKPHHVACTPVMPASAIPSYIAAKESEGPENGAEEIPQLEREIRDAMEILETGEAPAKKKPQFVGDIEVGGHNITPKDKKLEKGVIVGGGKETLLGTIAKSSGWVAGNDELNKLGIKSAKDMDGVKKAIEKAADGKSWHLDVVETPRGRELRGVIEDPKGDKEPQKKEQDKEEKVSKEEQEGSEEEYKDEL